MSTEKQILVLGGTVFLSRTIAEHAVARGHQVTVASRGATGAPPEGAEFVTLDRATGDGLDALRGRAFDAVFDVARIPAHIGPVLDALADDAGHWSFVSTISVYKHFDILSEELHEPTAADSTDAALEAYGPSKVVCEQLVRERLGDKAFITRPGLIVGPGDRNDRLGYWPLRFAEGGEVLAPGPRERPVQWIDVDDYADFLLDAADTGEHGTVDAIGAPVEFGAFLDQVGEALVEHGVLSAPPELTWVSQEFLLEQGVNPWSGPDSLGMWVPTPDYDGFQTRPTGPAAAAGFRASDLADTVKRWWHANAEAPHLKAGLSRQKEGEVLAAWHDKPTAEGLAELDAERRFAVPQAETPAYDG
ncbi:NAD-dependent epimerase/dehydratase family protein [Glycomyces niveus]|uniref:NAD-dependent epimerase/dehydratase family protein n=1 Tax=Glycomyces niveus TaxID=2820287 RepID=A0ABS3U3W4_9ACTN|nr:NAD-dependent epimerase/dehydratase family protein [Glycomyces sp. NEAU-S30]MBO3733468.1 NAD-dependent epimerase/dehydratase family protein [Glycomyces sp. NEAU-S30]